jgi:predicted HicB family RNase H-like nuclease
LGIRTGLGAGFGTIVLVLALAAGSALGAMAEPPTRGEYVDALELVCKPRAEITQKAMDGVRQDVRKPNRIPIAARKFDRAANIFGGTVERISKVAQPQGDEAKLKVWFVYLDRQTDYLEQIAAQLHKGKTIKAQRLTARFIHNGNLSNNVVLAFGFDYCSFKFSRYG